MGKGRMPSIKGKALESSTKVKLVPQIAFISACAGGVFYYVYNNIEQIKAQQEVTINRVMTEQKDNVNAAQAQQKKNIEDIQRQQQARIDEIKKQQTQK